MMGISWFALLLVCVASAQDTVELDDGGFVRGEIHEWIVGDHVTIQTAEGEVLRIEAAHVREVVRGGRMALASPRRPSSVRAETAATERLTLSLTVDGAPGPSCELPCTTYVEGELIDVRVGVNEGRPRRPRHRRFEVGEGLNLSVSYESRGDVRTAGWVTFSLFLATAVGFAAGGLVGELFAGGSGTFYLVLGAPIALLLALAIGLPLAALSDHLDVVALE